MKIRTQNYDNTTVIGLQGEFDGDHAELFKDAITETGISRKSNIVLDMTDVGFIDSQGLEQLLWAKDYCIEHNCSLKLAGLAENCKKIMEITRLESEFDSYTELAEAVRSFT